MSSRYFFFVVFQILYAKCAYSQIQDISGIVRDHHNYPVKSAQINIYTSSDSTLILTTNSNDTGSFHFSLKNPFEYFLEINTSSGGHLKIDSLPMVQSDSIFLGLLVLSAPIQTFTDFRVKIKRPMIEYEADKTIYNVENNINMQSSNLYEMLEKIPGITIDKDGNISIKGKAGARVLINGKIPGANGQDLSNTLKGINSASVARIEIITNPSSKYDASGKGGIINVILKKSDRNGLNGNLFEGVNFGRYLKSNQGFQFNYKRSNYNFNLRYIHSDQKGFTNLILNRKYALYNNTSNIYKSDNYIIDRSKTNNLSIGMEYDISKSSAMSISLSSQLNNHTSKATDQTSIFKENQLRDSYSDFINNSLFKRDNYVMSVSYQRLLDSNGTKLNVGLDYMVYKETSNQKINTTFHSSDGNINSEIQKLGAQKIKTGTLVSFVDFEMKTKRNFKIESGMKIFNTNYTNSVGFSDTFSMFNSKKSIFNYSENIVAGYINVERQIDKLNIQMGIRTEGTNSIGNSEGLFAFHRTYVKVFPSVMSDYKINDRNEISFSLGRRIERPSVELLNPYKKILNPTTYLEGNPMLLPETGTNIELTYNFRNKLIVTCGHSSFKNSLNTVLVQDTTTKTTFQTVVNLYRYIYNGLDLTYNKTIKNRTSISSNLQFYIGTYKGKIQSYDLDKRLPTFSMNTSVNHSFNKKTKIEFGIIYNYRSFYGVTTLKSNNNIFFGFQRGLLNNKLNLSINIADVLWKSYARGFTAMPYFEESWSAKRDTRMLKFNLTYKFTNKDHKINQIFYK